MPPRKRKGLERQKDKLEGLTERERKDIEFMSNMMYLLGGDTPQVRRMVKFNEQHRRLSYLMTHTLDKLKTFDRLTYTQIVHVVRGHYQFFLDAINKIEALNPEGFYLRADQMMVTSSDLQFSSLFTNDGFKLRAAIIGWLSQNDKAPDVVRLLKELQKLLPEVTGNEEELF